MKASLLSGFLRGSPTSGGAITPSRFPQVTSALWKMGATSSKRCLPSLTGKRSAGQVLPIIISPTSARVTCCGRLLVASTVVVVSVSSTSALAMALLLLVQLTSIAIRQRMIERGRFIFVLLLKYNKQSYNKNTDAPTHIVWCTYFFIGEMKWGSTRSARSARIF